MSQQLILPLTLPPSFEMGDFIPSSANEEALSWLGKWPIWPQRTLLIYGDKGCGKTHLASIWKAQAHLLAPGEITVRALDLLLATPDQHFVLDDAEKVADEEAFFHLLNAVRGAQGSLLLLSDLHPQQWEMTLPDLKSRLNALFSVKIQEPDDLLIKGLIKKYFADQQIPLADEVRNYLFHHLPRSYSGLLTSFERINENALSQKRSITIPLVKNVLET